MVKLSASFKVIGSATILAGVASAVPMDYNYGAGAASASSPYVAAAAYGASSSSSAAPSWQTASAASQYGSAGNSYGSGMSMGMGSSMSMSAQSTAVAAPPSYTPSTYGSGSMTWNSGTYDNCVQQCVAQFGTPPSMYLPPPSSSGVGSSGTGATHTVWVAPTQGVLRYVPFSVDAAIGDTVKFIWGANVHTVTKSSQLDICNKTGDVPFASGIQNKTFVFTQRVNDTNSTFYYCGVPTHCQKGMFGIINPPSAPGQPGSAAMMLPIIANSTASTQAAWSYMTNITAGQPAAAAWGNDMDMSKMPSWAQSYAAENVMYTKSFFALNPETISQAGAVDLSPLNTNPVSFPSDVAAVVRLADNASANGTSTSSGATPSSTGKSNSAGALSSPRAAVAFVAVVAAFFAL